LQSITSRAGTKLEETVSQVREAGAEGVLVQGDTSAAKRAGEIVEEAAAKLGGYIFVQSVVPTLDRIYEHTLATEVPLAKWQIAFDTQARAFFVRAPAAGFSRCLTHRGQ
jgi:hypothetical protein